MVFNFITSRKSFTNKFKCTSRIFPLQSRRYISCAICSIISSISLRLLHCHLAIFVYITKRKFLSNKTPSK